MINNKSYIIDDNFATKLNELTDNKDDVTIKLDKKLIDNNNIIKKYKDNVENNNNIINNAIKSMNENINQIINDISYDINQFIDISKLKKLLKNNKNMLNQYEKNIIGNNTDIINFLEDKYNEKIVNNKKKLELNIIKNINNVPLIGVSIIICVYEFNNKLYIGCHFDNNPSQYRYKKIGSCAGHVDEGESYTDAAIREAKEEHGLTISDENKLQFISQNINTKNNKCYKYYCTYVLPSNYLTKDILTPDEIFYDEKYINNVFSKFPENSVINTGARSTFLIHLDVLTSQKYKKYIYSPFFNFLTKLKNNKIN
jgi:8-oxo-dGTP pyrophosphatase MutT (NUDIX family)